MADTYRVLWMPVAVRDLDSIVDFVAEDSPAAAISLARDIMAAASRLSYFPLRCKRVPELSHLEDNSCRDLLIGPYRIVIDIEGDTVAVLGVFDGRRDLQDVLLHRIIRRE